MMEAGPDRNKLRPAQTDTIALRNGRWVDAATGNPIEHAALRLGYRLDSQQTPADSSLPAGYKLDSVGSNDGASFSSRYGGA